MPVVYSAVERFDPVSGENWRKFVAWSGLTQLWEVVSLDCILCPSIFAELTAEAIQNVRRAAPRLPVIASGGLRDGIEAAKCVALGAGLCGLAGPFLKAAAISAEATSEAISELARELRIAMFAAGAGNIAQLQATPLLRQEA